MPAGRRLVALFAAAAAAAAAAPAPAIAQSGGAGDQQYVDPFGGQSQQQTAKKQSPTPAAEPAQGAPSTASPGSTAATSSGAASPRRTLPRTGMDAGLVAALGLALLVAGAAMRLRLRDERL